MFLVFVTSIIVGTRFITYIDIIGVGVGILV